MRLGSYYRACVMSRLGILPQGEAVLEVGAFDGYLVALSRARIKLGIDLEPAPSAEHFAPMVLGDGRRLPFRESSFDAILLMDVAEHEQRDSELLGSIVGSLKEGGALYMSVPSRDFTAFPPFITNTLHKSWGHVRPGYTAEELTKLLPENMPVTIIQWNEPFFRLLYIPIWLLWRLFPPAARLILRLAALLDQAFPKGTRGHLFLIARLKKGSPESGGSIVY
ncbi:MAG: class I SAM-dependent methyltransferase [Dehalococcoidia bacterium]|nr:class I SAM-dependent methyltransferase [Dehalococcoidia bacterium]